jgi:hypothetical protein
MPPFSVLFIRTLTQSLFETDVLLRSIDLQVTVGCGPEEEAAGCEEAHSVLWDDAEGAVQRGERLPQEDREVHGLCE